MRRRIYKFFQWVLNLIYPLVLRMGWSRIALRIDDLCVDCVFRSLGK